MSSDGLTFANSTHRIDDYLGGETSASFTAWKEIWAHGERRETVPHSGQGYSHDGEGEKEDEHVVRLWYVGAVFTEGRGLQSAAYIEVDVTYNKGPLSDPCEVESPDQLRHGFDGDDAVRCIHKTSSVVIVEWPRYCGGG